MGARSRRSEATPELTERQRYWLRHIRAAERKGESLKGYAKRRQLSEHSLYEAKRRLREHGVLPPATPRRPCSQAPQFVRVVSAEAGTRAASPLRLQLTSGAVLEWSEAPAGEALRELLGWLR